jgi:pimeloyl-ACP methyl ester carboxylesterase
VPLDYANPNSRRISIALIRMKAREPANRIGSLVVNPGGPGGSGVAFVRSWGAFFPREITARFDIVGFDPRGVGESSPLLCHDNVQGLAGLDSSPETNAEWRQNLEVARSFAELCGRRGGDLLAHLGTRDVVRDLEEIRIALGDEKLTYAGFSYGTAIGALYADAHPGRVRAMVLDGPIDPTLNAEQLAIQQSRGFEGAFERFLADCRARRCLPAEAGDPAAAVEELTRRAEVVPIPSERADRAAGPGEVLLGLFAGLYTPRLWSDLEDAIEQGLEGDGTGLIRLVDSYLGRQPDGAYDNQTEMYNAVACLDADLPRDAGAFLSLIEKARAAAPRFGAVNVYTWLPCAFWPAPAAPVQPPTARGAPPILILGTTADPATPYAWAVAASDQLEPAVLLTYRGDGHTAYLSLDRCVTEAVHRYVIELQVPPAGTVCGDGPAEPLVVAEPASPKSPDSVPPPDAPAPEAAAPEGAGEETTTVSDRWVLPAVVAASLAVAPAAYLLARRVSRRRE